MTAQMLAAAPTAPAKWLFAAELPRALGGVVSHAWWRRRLADAPRGDGRPVLFLPGLGNSDTATLPIRSFLKRRGYDARGWGLGVNRGARSIGMDEEKLGALIRAIFEETGETVTVIGVSLGGLMARVAGHRWPDMVRQVITVSAPYAGDVKATNVWRAFEWLCGEKVDGPRMLAMRALVARAPPVPTTAIWSASDGLVNGAICHGDDCPSVEVRSTHVMVQSQPGVMLAVARALAACRAETGQ